MIDDAVTEQWPDFPEPKWWKAQLCQESRLDPMARSPVGAQGLAQIMPATYQQVIRELRWEPSAFDDPFDPEHAIQAGAYYQGKLRRAWGAAGRSGEQRNELGQAAYNAGLGSILKAQQRCQDARYWPGIAPCLEQITGTHAKETLDYVVRIRAFWKLLEGE